MAAAQRAAQAPPPRQAGPTGPPAVVEPRIFRWRIDRVTGEEMTKEVVEWRRALPSDSYVSEPKYMCEAGFLIVIFGVMEPPSKRGAT